jgi:Ca2+-transporting ATPase
MEIAHSKTLYEQATTMCLAGIVATQIGNAIAIRTDRKSIFTACLFTNRLLWGIVSEVLILLALSYVPFLQSIFSTAPLTATGLMFLIIIPPLMLHAEEQRKPWVHWRTKRMG